MKKKKKQKQKKNTFKKKKKKTKKKKRQKHPRAARLGPRHGRPHARVRDHLHPVTYTHLRAHETRHDIVCRLMNEKKKKTKTKKKYFQKKKKKNKKKKETETPPRGASRPATWPAACASTRPST